MLSQYEQVNDLLERYPVLGKCGREIEKAYTILCCAFENGKKVLIAGNGGSAADAEHIVGELMKGFANPRMIPEDMRRKLMITDPERGINLCEKLQGALPAMALTGHIALSTAYLNDVDGSLIFAQQLLGYGNPGDVFWALTTSGNSENILNAAVVAKAKGLKTIALTGKDGGLIRNIADVSIIVPEEETYKIQELHLPIYHTLCLMMENHFWSREGEIRCRQ